MGRDEGDAGSPARKRRIMTTNQSMGTLRTHQENSETPTRASRRLDGVTWSYSRRNLIEQCPRRYYFAYYGSNKNVALKDPQKPLLMFLKRLSSRYERAGSILHLTIATALRNSLKGRTIDSTGLQRWARGIFEKDIEYSIRDPRGQNPSTERFPPVLLREFYYDQDDAEGECRGVMGSLTSGIGAFAEEPSYAAFRELRNHPRVLIESWTSLSDFPCRVNGRVDLAVQTDTSVLVLDWKMGHDSNVDDSLQLASYALWACDHFDVSPESVQIMKAPLADGVLISSQVDEGMLRRGQARILQDVELMNAMDEYGKNGQSDAFTPCAQAGVCSFCPFLEACEEGRDCVSSGN